MAVCPQVHGFVAVPPIWRFLSVLWGSLTLAVVAGLQ